MNDIRNRRAGARNRCGRSRRKCEPPDEQEDDRNNKEEREKCAISASSEKMTRTMLKRVV